MIEYFSTLSNKLYTKLYTVVDKNMLYLSYSQFPIYNNIKNQVHSITYPQIVDFLRKTINN